MSVTFGVELRDADGVYRGVRGTPEVNFSNGNANAVLSALGRDLAPDYCGSMTPQEFEAGLARFERAVAQGRGSEFERSTEHSGGPGTGRCEVYSCGLDLTGLARRLDALAQVARAAADLDAEMGWG